jgi:integrase
MLWGLMDVQRNPMKVVKLKGTSKRQKKPQILTPEKFQDLIELPNEPHKTMVYVAMCTGMRLSEVLALRWEHIDFEAGVMLLQRGVVDGRIGKVKTEASNDYIPLDFGFAQSLLSWKGSRESGLVFPSHVTGDCYYAGIIQQKVLKPTGEKVGIQGLGWYVFRTRTILSWTKRMLQSASSRNSCGTATSQRQ